MFYKIHLACGSIHNVLKNIHYMYQCEKDLNDVRFHKSNHQNTTENYLYINHYSAIHSKSFSFEWIFQALIYKVGSWLHCPNSGSGLALIKSALLTSVHMVMVQPCIPLIFSFASCGGKQVDGSPSLLKIRFTIIWPHFVSLFLTITKVYVDAPMVSQKLRLRCTLYK